MHNLYMDVCMHNLYMDVCMHNLYMDPIGGRGGGVNTRTCRSAVLVQNPHQQTNSI